MKRTITLDIAGMKLRLVSDGEPDRLQELAAMINERADKLNKPARNVSSPQLIALAALALADELRTAERKLHEVDELTRTTIRGAIARIDDHLRDL